jgi:hypothetical protein
MMNYKIITIRFLMMFGVCVATRATLLAADSPVVAEITVQPKSMQLVHRRHPHSILVTGRLANGQAIDLTSQATFESSNKSIANVNQLGWVEGVSTGASTVKITAAGKTIQVSVDVNLPAAAKPFSFRHDVMPVLSKSGCNAGACHGYSLGKNGFKLSLRGSDPDKDFMYLTDEFFERRVNRHNPAASLLVTKPLGDVPHKGGVRFEHGSLSHEYLLGWVTDGAKSDVADPVQLKSIEIFPKKVVLAPNDQQQLQVLASYSDGSIRDVTRLGVYTVNTQRVANVTDEGLVTSTELGESAVSARFERIFATANFIVLKPDASFEPTPVPTDLIDKFVIQKLNDLNIKPSELCDDSTFLRRVYLDLIGIQPTPDEVRAFLADQDPAKRVKTVDALFDRSEFVDQWSLKWGDLLQNSRTVLSDPAVYAFREWIRSAVASNLPLDEFVKTILTGRGGVSDDPTAAYFAISKDTDDTLQRATQVFCGVRMLCAKCHPHPFENWTQGDYFGLHSFFNQVTTKPDPRLTGVARAKSVMLNLTVAYSRNPRTGKLQPPRFLGGGEPEIPKGVDHRIVYADWLTSSSNPFFGRSMANRIWSYFFHRGIIDPVDDLRTTNPPINPELLDALTKEFIANKFNVRQLMRTIVLSKTYQRSSLANPTNGHDDLNFSRAIPRRLSAEALLDSLVQATAVPEAFAGAPAGFSAKQLPDANVKSEFLNLFGKPKRMESCECERDDGSNMLQALHFINGKSILSRVTNANGRVARLLREKDITNEKIVADLYLWSLARMASPQEIQLGLTFFKSYKEKRKEAAEDFMWALLNSKDFMLVH